MKSYPIWITTHGTGRKHDPAFGGPGPIAMEIRVGSSSSYSEVIANVAIIRQTNAAQVLTAYDRQSPQSDTEKFMVTVNGKEVATMYFNRKTKEFHSGDATPILTTANKQVYI